MGTVYLAEPQATDGWPLRHVPPQRAVAWPVIVLALATEMAAVLLMQLVVYRDADRWAPWAVEIRRATGGIVEFTLMGCLLLQVVVVGVVLMGIGRLRPIALGLDIRKVAPAVAWTCTMSGFPVARFASKPAPKLSQS